MTKAAPDDLRTVTPTPVQGLAAWDLGDSVPPERYAAMIAHPRFAEAVRTLAGGMLDLAAAHPALNAVFKDAGRYMATLWMQYLQTIDDLTLPRLKAFCVSSKLLSPGRARTLVHLLQHLGYVQVSQTALGRAAARYAPTDRFIAEWAGHHRAALRAASVIEPAVGPLIAALDDRDTYWAFTRIQSEGLLDASEGIDHDAPFNRVFLHSYAGLQIIWFLLSQSEGDDLFPPAGARLPVRAAAERFGVSQMHIKRFLVAAEREQLLSRSDDGAIVIGESMTQTIKYLYADQLIRLLIASGRTLREMRAEARPI